MQVWCAVKTNDTRQQDGTFEGRFDADNLGFRIGIESSSMKDWDQEKYPYLRLWYIDPDTGEDAEFDISGEELMQEHFVNMLRYMQDQKKFCEMMDADADHFGEAADFVEENGIMIYGFAATADKVTLLEWNEKKEIYSITTEKME